jgi:hypothetical protein
MSSAPPAAADFVWGSFERNTGTWCAYAPDEGAAIEVAFARGEVARCAAVFRC